MTLRDLVDLEAQLARDRDASPADLERRDRALMAGRRLDPSRRGELLRAWIEALRAAEPGHIDAGRRVASALGWVRAALVALGLLVGWSASTALLAYDGREPVDVWSFLLALVGLQILLLALLLLSFALPVSALGLPFLGLFRGAVAWAYPRLVARGFRGAEERLAEWRLLWHGLRSRRSLYHHLEPWLLLGLTQAFGVAFNVGALVGCLRLIAFSDLAFAWSTTLVQLDAERFHGLVHLLATPFASLWPEADPSRALVEATRWSRLAGAYVGASAGRAPRPDLVGGWWPFLAAALVCYGLLPRAITLAVSTGWAARLRERLPLDDAAVSRVVRRLCEPHVETRSPEPEAPPPAPAPPPPEPAPLDDGGTRCAAVLWRDVPAGPTLERHLAERLGCRDLVLRSAGGRDFEEAPPGWEAVARCEGPVAVVAEAFEAPDKATLRLLRELRGALGPRRHVVVLLVETSGGAPCPPAALHVRIWEEGIQQLADPYLSIEPFRGEAGTAPLAEAVAAPPRGRA